MRLLLIASGSACLFVLFFAWALFEERRPATKARPGRRHSPAAPGTAVDADLVEPHRLREHLSSWHGITGASRSFENMVRLHRHDHEGTWPGRMPFDAHDHVVRSGR